MDLFAPYLNNDGVVRRLTLVENLDYSGEKLSWQWYQHRDDFLEKMENDFETKTIIEIYGNGRSDSISRNFVHQLVGVVSLNI